MLTNLLPHELGTAYHGHGSGRYLAPSAKHSSADELRT